MPTFGRGSQRAFGEVVGGIVTSLLLATFVNSGILKDSDVFVFNLINMMATVVLILAMPYWGTLYLLGWAFALYILLNAGMMGAFEFVVYFGVPLIILIIRIAKEMGYDSGYNYAI